MVKKKLDYIDALRGLAILGVIVIHASQYGKFEVPKIIGNVILEGNRGVQLFYLASAFTLFLSFKNRSTKERFPVQNFFLRRFFRIAPMYYVGIVYYLFQDGLGPRYWLGNETHITVANIISNCIFLHGFNPYWITSLVPGGWSIGVEMTFYAMVPLLFSKLKNIDQAFMFFIISIIIRLLFQLVLTKYPLISDDELWSNYLFFYFPSQLPVFCLGIITYFIVIQKEDVRNISGVSILIFSFLLMAQLILGIQLLFPQHILFAIGFLFLGLAVSKNSFKIIVNPVIKYIGKISFSMYIVHFAVLHWLNQFNFINYFNNGLINYVARFLLVSVLTVFISSILYKIIEIPFQEMGKKIINRLEDANK